jgi:hypothetical protein
MGERTMKSINSMGILVAALCAIILIGIAGCGGTDTETIVQITEPANDTLSKALFTFLARLKTLTLQWFKLLSMAKNSKQI